MAVVHRVATCMHAAVASLGNAVTGALWAAVPLAPALAWAARCGKRPGCSPSPSHPHQRLRSPHPRRLANQRLAPVLPNHPLRRPLVCCLHNATPQRLASLDPALAPRPRPPPIPRPNRRLGGTHRHCERPHGSTSANLTGISILPPSRSTAEGCGPPITVALPRCARLADV